jgi:hypothetical protein
LPSSAGPGSGRGVRQGVTADPPRRATKPSAQEPRQTVSAMALDAGSRGAETSAEAGRSADATSSSCKAEAQSLEMVLS